jgi:hypothetical protein
VTDPGDRPTADGAGPTDPAETPARPPTTGRDWVRRGVILVALVAAAALLVWGTRDTESGLEGGSNDPVIVSRVPLPDAIEPRQVDIGAELQIGYDGRLQVNGVDIPEDEMIGAVDPATVSAEELERLGIRPNNRNTVRFRPGPGKVIESLPRGEVEVTVTYFRDRSPQENRGSDTWTFTVN